MEETIREYGGKVIGYVETAPNGDKTVRSFYGRLVGIYEASSNTTRGFTGGAVTLGDAAVGMLLDPRYNPDYGK